MAAAASGSIVTAAINQYGQYRDNMGKAFFSNLNAMVAGQNIELIKAKRGIAKRTAKLREDNIRARGEMTKSSQRSIFGKSGVSMEGTPLETLKESARNIELDALSLRFASATEQVDIATELAGAMQARAFSLLQASQFKSAAAASDPFAATKGGTFSMGVTGSGKTSGET